tara:strand:+ start:2482 stop:4521 length:2040 start_codon:yes stop_codon:yes gene_type:complete
MAGFLTSQQLSDVAFKTIQLSYIQTDRAVGILKSLGYSVIDFSVASGPNPNELIFEPQGEFAASLYKGLAAKPEDLPIVIMLPETENITLLEMQGAAAQGQGAQEMGVDLGGASLIYTTSGEPLQRLMIAYDPNDPETLSRLVNILTNEIDVAAVQVIIEALIIEIDSDKIDELGINLSGRQSLISGSTPAPDPETGGYQPFSLVLDKTLLGTAVDLEAKLQALISTKSADILSRPSVLVLDGRQARIVVGQQIPIARSTATGQNVVSATEYIPVGIVLNLRPRVSGDRNSITIQVETIISEAVERIGIGSVGSDLLSAPVFNSRKVQTYVQVANRTPFIIGGLISKKKSDQRGGVPILGSLPLIGNLFSFQRQTDERREVIVVLTPNLVDVTQRNFTRVIPKDSEIFSSLGNMLFQNSYRVLNRDVYDFGFIYTNPVYTEMVADITALQDKSMEAASDPDLNRFMEGSLPGEGILVRRMLYDLVERVDYYKYIRPGNVIYFVSDPSDPSNTLLRRFSRTYEEFLRRDGKRGKGLVLSFRPDELQTDGGAHLSRPVAGEVTIDIGKGEDYKRKLRSLNQDSERPAVLLYDPDMERRLYEVMVLRRILEMNPNITQNISNFKPGIEIIFPSPEALESDVHVLDIEIARYFFEINNYNNSFDAAFLRGMDEIGSIIDSYFE